jgi:hypothetical protein
MCLSVALRFESVTLYTLVIPSALETPPKIVPTGILGESNEKHMRLIKNWRIYLKAVNRQQLL